MKRFVWLLLMVSIGLLFAGCASVKETDSDSEQVSTIPWNRPASWEGRGPLGGMMMMDGR